MLWGDIILELHVLARNMNWFDSYYYVLFILFIPLYLFKSNIP